MVYVDDMRARYGRMTMAHMIADTDDELHAMADKIGVARRWFQKDHYDVCVAKRALAVKLGAREITWREAGAMVAARRKAFPCGTCEGQGTRNYALPNWHTAPCPACGGRGWKVGG